MNDLRDDRDLADFEPIAAKGAARSPRRWLVAHAIAWGLSLLVLIVAARRFEAIFQDFGVDLPGITMLVIKIGHVGVLLLPLVAIVLGADWVVLNATARSREPKSYRAWAIAMMIVPVVFFGATIAALAVPALMITRLRG